MVSNKKRLYIALYPSGGGSGSEEPRYHWGFLVGPKHEGTGLVPGTRYHVKNPAAMGWVYDEAPLANVQNTMRLLARVLIAKVVDEARLADVFRGVPVVQEDPAWRCRTWVAEVLRRLGDARAGTVVGANDQLDWAVVEPRARAYVVPKVAAGRFGPLADTIGPKPTYDLMTGREILP